ncbi:MAG: hypothetical protein KAT68_13445 [Bacteroidales bacterium]|nr:hypothetical protein [Bacteroidales bacterium]
MDNLTCKKCGTILFSKMKKCPMCGAIIKTKNRTVTIIVIIIMIYIIISVFSPPTQKNNTNNVHDAVWAFTMNYGDDNLGYSIEGQVNLIVQVMRLQGSTCYITDRKVTPSNGSIYRVSLKVVCPDTNEEALYEWITNMNLKTVSPRGFYANQFTYP